MAVHRRRFLLGGLGLIAGLWTWRLGRGLTIVDGWVLTDDDLGRRR